MSALFVGMMTVNADPNHLEPISPYSDDSDGYYKAVFDVLVGHGRPECWMICRPSFKPEFAIILHKVQANPDKEDPFALNSTWTWMLESVTVEHQIWKYNEEPGGKLTLDLRKSIVPIRRSVEVSSDFGEAILRSWRAVLRLTRYSEDPDQGLDGVDYDFQAGGYFGTTWLPKDGLPAELVKAAVEMKVLVESAPERRLELLSKSAETARKLEAAAEEQHIKLNASSGK